MTHYECDQSLKADFPTECQHSAQIDAENLATALQTMKPGDDFYLLGEQKHLTIIAMNARYWICTVDGKKGRRHVVLDMQNGLRGGLRMMKSDSSDPLTPELYKHLLKKALENPEFINPGPAIITKIKH